MRVVFLEDVQGVAEGGEVKEVKNGFARNYLIPKSLAVPATHNALQRVKRLTKQAEGERLKRLKDTRALAEELDGVQVNIEMRSGASGRLFGSVTSSIIAAELSRLTGREIDRRTVELAEPIRELGVSDVTIRLLPEVEAGVKVLVYATGTEPVMVAEEEAAEQTAEQTAGDEQSEVDVPAEDVPEETKEPAEPEDVTKPSEEPEESE